MYELIISGHIPNINEQNVIRNTTIQIFLNDEIDTTSISDNNIVVTDYLYNPVPGKIGWDYTNKGTMSGVANILTFTPDSFLDPETTYSVFVNKYPDSVKSVNDNFIQQTYKYVFYTGIEISGNPTDKLDQLEKDLQAAIARGDWCEVARISGILSGPGSECSIIPPSGITPPILPDFLEVINHWPAHMQSNIPMDRLRFIKLEFNDIMRSNEVYDYSSFITVIEKGVLE